MISRSPDDASLSLPALAELQVRPQWVCWRSEERNGKRTKVPYNPRTGKLARSNDPTTWTSYQLAQAVYERESARYSGVGFVFHQDYTGVDLDHCVRPDGQIDAWARDILQRLASYAEYSPNDGIHVFLRGTVPAGLRRRLSCTPHAEAALEMYCAGRYFTMTGHHVPGTPATLGDVTSELQTIVLDLGLIEQAAQARNGAKFRALWQGDTTGYLSASEADQALCNLLAFWSGPDTARLDRLFRSSGLYRPEKWDRAARTGETYGQGTIARSLAARSTEVARNTAGEARQVGTIVPFRAKASQGEDEAPQMEDLPVADLAYVLDCLAREEEGDARLYAFLFRGRCLYDHSEGLWYEWQGHVWQRDEQKHALVLASNPLAAVYLQASAALSEQAAQQARQLDLELTDAESERQKEQYARLKKETAALIERVRRLKTLKRMQNVLTISQALLPITSKSWDRNPWLLACANGVLDLRTGELEPGRPEDYIRSAIPTEWRGLDAPAPRWEQFLQEVFDDRDERTRADLIAFVQRLLGYGITGDVSEHVFLVFYGEEGRNGKDTIQRAISHTLGGISSAISKDVLLEAGRARTAGSATPHICDLQGKRLAWASEPEKGARFSVSQVKEYSGGGEIPSRGMYERAISKIKPTHLLILLSNHKPYADADDKAFWDRLRLVTFNLRFVDQPAASNERKKDTKLWQTLEAEASGILAWLVRGCLEWQRSGLGTPPAILADGEQYRREQDALDLFLSSCCELDEQASVRAATLYEVYVSWGKANNLRSLMTGTSFGKKLAKRFAKIHTKQGAAYQGIVLLAEERSERVLPFEQASSGLKENSAAVTGLTKGDGLNRKPVTIVQPASEAEGDTYPTPYGDGLTGIYRKSPKKAKSGPVGELPVPTRQPVTNEKSDPLTPPVESLQNGDGFADQPVTTRHNPSPEEGIRWPVDAAFVRTIDGLGYRTGNRQEKDVAFIAPERQAFLRYTYGVVSLLDGIEHFYYPRMLTPVTREEVEAWLTQQRSASNGVEGNDISRTS